MAPDSASLRDARRRLGKTSLMPVQCGTEADTAARIVGKHALPISPSGDWFALFRLCKVDRVSNYGGLGKLVSVTVPVPSMLSPVKLT